MKFHGTTLFATLIIVAQAGNTGEPPAPVATPKAAVAATAPATPGTTSATTDAAAETAKTAHELGYAPRLRNGKTVYCRRAPQLGTRLETMTCLTGDEVSAMKKRSLDNKDSIDQMQRKELTEANKG